MAKHPELWDEIPKQLRGQWMSRLPDECLVTTLDLLGTLFGKGLGVTSVRGLHDVHDNNEKLDATVLDFNYGDSMLQFMVTDEGVISALTEDGYKWAPLTEGEAACIAWDFVDHHGEFPEGYDWRTGLVEEAN